MLSSPQAAFRAAGCSGLKEHSPIRKHLFAHPFIARLFLSPDYLWPPSPGRHSWSFPSTERYYCLLRDRYISTASRGLRTIRNSLKRSSQKPVSSFKIIEYSHNHINQIDGLWWARNYSVSQVRRRQLNYIEADRLAWAWARGVKGGGGVACLYLNWSGYRFVNSSYESSSSTQRLAILSFGSL